MTFRSLEFGYTPPPTVIPPSVAVSTSTNTPSSNGSKSNAGLIITQLNDLADMSKYLQAAIVGITNTMGIELDPAVDPNTAKALCSIYGTDNPPAFITIPMYNAILDAQMGAQQLEMAVGNNSSIQPNPVQVADLTTVISAVNNALVQSATYESWLPLQLASLKSDAIVFQSMAVSLSTYPAYYSNPTTPQNLQTSTVQVADVDISSSLYDYQNDAISRFNQTYANVFQALATASPVEQDVANIAAQLFTQSLPNMLQLQGLFTSLTGLAYKPAMTSLTGDTINYTFARLASDVGGMLTNADQLVSMVSAPLQGNLGALSSIVAGVQSQSASLGIVVGGAMAGMSKGNSYAASNPSNGLTTQSNGIPVTADTSLTVPGFGPVSEGVKQLAENINWGQNTIQNGLSLLTTSFQQLMEHRLSQQNDRQAIMGSMRTMGTLTTLVGGIINAVQAGTITSNPSPKQQQEAANSILTSLQTGSITTFTTSGNQIIVNSPTLPPVTPPVQRVLSRVQINVPLGKIVA